MKNIGGRIKQVRQDQALSLSAFGERLGMAKSSVSALENGVNNPAERTVKVICSEFGVNYDWLKNGEGPVYSNLPETLIDELVEEYDLDDLDRRIIESYIKLTKEEREVFKKFLGSLLESDRETAASTNTTGIVSLSR